MKCRWKIRPQVRAGGLRSDMAVAWRHISRSVQGESHVADGTPCQDSSRVRRLDGKAAGTLVACVADGAGSAKHSGVGSLAACNAVLESVDAFLEADGKINDLAAKDAIKWCDLARCRIEEEANARDARPNDFATTISVAIISPQGSCFFQIGDGAIVLRSRGVSGVVFWPESGEYVNTTTFHNLERVPRSTAVLRDGAQLRSGGIVHRRHRADCLAIRFADPASAIF